MVADETHATWVTEEGGTAALHVRRFRLTVTAGPDLGLVRELAQPVVRIGARPSNDVVLSDRRVSGAHCEVWLDRRGFRLRDLESTNGTTVAGVRVLDAYLAPGQVLGIGKNLLRFDLCGDDARLPLQPAPSFGRLIGASPLMRHVFHDLGRIAASDVTVLIGGETGTGKELVAEAIHDASPRATGPLVVVDCGATVGSLFEDELFGHERGAFTGAERAAEGAFERAHGGTLFLDEIGELPLDLQPKLLRAIESRRVRRLGGSRDIACDVRIVAATNRDLAREVNRGSFREDLFYRLAVARVHVPPLRDRPEDIMPLVHHFLASAGSDASRLTDETARALVAHHWPGNVRELRNAVERLLVTSQPLAAGRVTAGAPAERLQLALEIDLEAPFKEAKQQVVDAFDRRFVEALLARHGGNVTAAARATGLDRVSIYKVMGRLGLRRRDTERE